MAQIVLVIMPISRKGRFAKFKSQKSHDKEGYHYSKFREGRDKNNFSFISSEDRLELIKGLEVENVISGEIEELL